MVEDLITEEEMDLMISYNKYILPIKGKISVVRLYQRFEINNRTYTFLGIKKKEEVPKVSCIYIDRDSKYVVIKDFERKGKVDKVYPFMPDDEITNLNGTDKPLDLEIKDEDNDLMVNMKIAMMNEKITSEDFRLLYIEDGVFNRSDANNDRNIIEKKHDLSWAKFTKFLKLMNLKYRIVLFTEEHEETPEDDKSKPLDLSVKDEDNDLLVNLKTVMLKKNITTDRFKEFYMVNGTFNRTDANNDRNIIEKKHDLSWAKFTKFLKLLNVKYKLIVYKQGATQNDI